MSESPTHGSPEAAASSSAGLSRRRFLQVAGGATGAAAVGAGIFEVVRSKGPSVSLPSSAVRIAGPTDAFQTRPDLRPPVISAPRPQNFDGDYLFMDPAFGGSAPGPLMVDKEGHPVWYKPIAALVSSSNPLATNFRPFTYRGEPVLAWWEGPVVNGLGKGEAVIVDSSYRQVARVRAVGRRTMDLHEFQLTPQGTALFTCNPETVPADLRSFGGPRHGTVLNSIFQEVDLRTGRLLLEWRSLDHIPISESYAVGPNDHHNYFHLNSIGLTPDGNLLLSGRNTWAMYKVDRRTGQVIWRLGGKRSDFTIGPGARFRSQHHARQPTDGTLTVFDNSSRLTYSRGLVLNIDETGRKVSLAQAFPHSAPQLLAIRMGSVQIRPNGNVVVGWGPEGYFTEFSRDGRVLSDAHQITGSYRVLILPWRGTPHRPPDVAVGRPARTGKTVVSVSWNGDTETAYWQVHVGQSASDMRSIGIARRRGFETAIPVGDVSGHFALTALDRNGRPLGHSRPVRL